MIQALHLSRTDILGRGDAFGILRILHEHEIVRITESKLAPHAPNVFSAEHLLAVARIIDRRAAKPFPESLRPIQFQEQRMRKANALRLGFFNGAGGVGSVDHGTEM